MFIYVDKDDRETYITFASKNPHRTRMLLISFMEDSKPTELLDALEQVGWAADNATMLPLLPASPLYGRLELSLHAKGSATFGFWNDDEKQMHMANARQVLRKFGIKGVPHRKLTLADMM